MRIDKLEPQYSKSISSPIDKNKMVSLLGVKEISLFFTRAAWETQNTYTQMFGLLNYSMQHTSSDGMSADVFQNLARFEMCAESSELHVNCQIKINKVEQ